MLLYLLNVLLKSRVRRRQQLWAESLAARLAPRMPLGVYIHAGGWWPGCEPFFEWRRLEYVELRMPVGPYMEVADEFCYRDAPTDDDVLAAANRLVASCN